MERSVLTNVFLDYSQCLQPSSGPQSNFDHSSNSNSSPSPSFSSDGAGPNSSSNPDMSSSSTGSPSMGSSNEGSLGWGSSSGGSSTGGNSFGGSSSSSALPDPSSNEESSDEEDSNEDECPSSAEIPDRARPTLANSNSFRIMQQNPSSESDLADSLPSNRNAADAAVSVHEPTPTLSRESAEGTRLPGAVQSSSTPASSGIGGEFALEDQGQSSSGNILTPGSITGPNVKLASTTVSYVVQIIEDDADRGLVL